MKQKLASRKKLALVLESVRTLDELQLQRAAGGVAAMSQHGNPCNTTLNPGI
ncbi:MAG TPA: hypothetical protein VGC42_25895 [Kofleriaceae bacterium]